MFLGTIVTVMTRRRSRLTPKQAFDFDGKVFAALYAQWARWEASAQRRGRRVFPLPPCPTGVQFRQFLPVEHRTSPRATDEVLASLDRLKGRQLVRAVPNKWGGGDPPATGEKLPNYCLVPVRAGGGNGSTRRKKARN